MMKLLSLLWLVFASTFAISQNCQAVLSGTVIDTHDDSALSGATVIVVETDKAVVTDFDGNFKIERLCEGTYNLQISHPECKTKLFTVDVVEVTSKIFRLEHHLDELNEIIVTGTGYVTKTESLLENRIDEEVIDSYSGATLGDALKSISGVSTLNTGNAVVKPVINGLHSSRITIINNGVRQQDQEWGAEHAPNLDLNTAGNITVLKGASALQYSGDAIGGIVVSEPDRFPIKDSLYGKTILSAQTNGRGGALTSQLVKTYSSGLYAKAQGTLKGYGDFEAPDYVLSNTGVREQALSAQFGLNKLNYGIDAYYSYFDSTIGILRASHIGGAEDQVAAINSERPLIIEDFTYDIDVPRQEVTHHLGKISAFAKLQNLGKVEFQYDVQYNNRFEFDVRRTDNNRPAVDLELFTHTALLTLDTHLIEEIHSIFGLTGSFQENSANPNTGVRRLIPDYKQYKAGAFAITDVQLTERLTGEAGVRYDYTMMDVFKFYRTSFWELRGYDTLFPEIVVDDFGNQILTNPTPTFNNFSATLGASYVLGEHFNIFANYAMASRAPNASELYSEGLHHSASRIELGDLRFTSERSQKFTATLQKKGGKLRFSVNPFANFINDFILIEPTGIQQTIRGNFQVWEYRQTKARLLGVDFDLQYDITDRLQYSNQFSLVKGQDLSNDVPLINMPPANVTNRISYGLQLPHPVNLGVNSQYIFKQNEFPDNNFEVFLPSSEQLETVDISSPPAAYHLLGLSASTEFDTGNNKTLALSIQLTNVLNTSYRDYLNRLRYYADDLGRNISLQLKYNY